MNDILIIEQIYRQASSRIDDIPGLFKALNQWYLTYPENNFLHPSIIDGKAALVCQGNLSNINAEAFAELRKIADRYHIYLKEDKRTRDASHEFDNRRKKIAFVLTFCLALLESSSMVMAGELRDHDVVNQASLGQLISHEVLEAYANNKSAMKIDERKAQLLVAHKANRAVFLQEALNQISAQAGIRFKVNTDISQVKIMTPVATDNWSTAVKALLTGYNWVAIQEDNALKTVIITGKIGDYTAPLDTAVDDNPLVFNTMAADEEKPFSNTAPKTQASAAQHAEKTVYLQEALNKITTLSDISFNVKTDISQIKVMPPGITDNWNAAVKALMTGYNWVAIQEDNALKTVIITGEIGDYVAPIDTSKDDKPLYLNIDEKFNKRLIAHLTDIRNL
jgi:hypothetical protein